MGRLIQLYGRPESGKTAFCLHLLKQVQAAGGYAAYFQTEGTFDEKWVSALGVNCSDDAMAKGIFIMPKETKYAAACFDAVETLLEAYRTIYGESTHSPLFLIVWDSLGASIALEEADKKMTKAPSPGRLAADISRGIRRLSSLLWGTNAAVVFINHVYSNIGVYFGPAERPKGGFAPHYFSDVILYLQAYNHKMPLIGKGIQQRVKLAKSKVSTDQAEILLDLYLPSGISNLVGLNDLSSLWSYAEEKHIFKAAKMEFSSIQSFAKEYQSSSKLRSELLLYFQDCLTRFPGLKNEYKINSSFKDQEEVEEEEGVNDAETVE